MRVMVFVKATKDSEAGMLPTTELLEAMGKFNEELVNAGIMQAGDGLKPSSKGKRVAFDGAKRTVIDGPFRQTNELVAGFWIWKVKDMAEAVAWVKRCPNPMPGPSEIEIRPFYEMADFGEVVTPEVAELRTERLRKKVGQPLSPGLAAATCDCDNCLRCRRSSPARARMVGTAGYLSAARARRRPRIAPPGRRAARRAGATAPHCR